MCIQVYYAIFYSYLNIGCNVWGFTSERNIDDIQVLQNKCVRIMTFAPFNSNTDQSFIDLGLLKVSEVIKLNQLKVVYDFYDKKLPDDLMSLFILSSNVHSTNQALNSAINNLIHIPRFGHCNLWKKFNQVLLCTIMEQYVPQWFNTNQCKSSERRPSNKN